MSKAIQYSTDGGATWLAQVSLSVADYTLPNGNIATYFLSVKSSIDDVYILCGYDSQYDRMKIIKISNIGIKTVSWLDVNNSAQQSEMQFISLSRDEQTLFFTALNNGIQTSQPVTLFSIPTNFSSGSITPTQLFQVWNYNGDGKVAIYQDRYIWVASGTTVKIYDYTTKAELASVALASTAQLIAVNTTNTAYCVDPSGALSSLVFNGISTITKTGINGSMSNTMKQLLIDKWGDLIILTNTGTASTLLKYTTAGVQVGATLSLGGAFYNLNTDALGSYYYSNALGSYKVAANTAQGQAFTGVGTKIRGSGMTTYGSNITGYAPAVFGTQE